MNWQNLADERATKGRPFVMAHRGASDIFQENSPSAFYRAISDGADVIETDIHFTKDEQIILMHDPTVDRTTDGHGRISEMTLADIKRLRLKQVGEPVLTLAEYVAHTGGKIPTALELKDPRFAKPRYASKLVQLLVDYDVIGFFGVISFELARVQAVQQAFPAMAAGWITLSNASPNHPVTFVGPFWPLLMLNPLYVRRAHKLGKMVCPLDPWPERRLPLYRRLNVDMLLSNNPAVVLQKLAARP